MKILQDYSYSYDDDYNPFLDDFNHDVYDSSYEASNGRMRQFIIPRRVHYGRCINYRVTGQVSKNFQLT